MTDDIVTSDLSEFGNRERAMAEELLKAWREQGLPDDFDDDGPVRIYTNRNSGYVFIANEEGGPEAMMNGDRLELWYSCRYCGSEGFKDEIHAEDQPSEMNAECVRYLKEIGAIDPAECETCGDDIDAGEEYVDDETGVILCVDCHEEAQQSPQERAEGALLLAQTVRQNGLERGTWTVENEVAFMEREERLKKEAASG